MGGKSLVVPLIETRTMNTYQITFNSRNKHDQIIRDEVEADSFSMNPETNTYEFYNKRNERVASAPRAGVTLVKQLR